MAADTYHVEPGGPPGTRTIQVDGRDVGIEKLSVGPMDNNAYLLTDLTTGEALLVDAADEADRILELVGDRDVVAIATTHGHHDHWQALAQVADATGAEVWIHPDDADQVPRAADRDMAHGGTIGFGGVEVELLHTPGHTPGSTCLLLGPTTLFTGDTLFPGGPGKTRSPELFATIMDSLQTHVFDRLPDETHVHPGHGDDTTLGAERPHLDEWRERGW